VGVERTCAEADAEVQKESDMCGGGENACGVERTCAEADVEVQK
jgi:hypothetical protein